MLHQNRIESHSDLHILKLAFDRVDITCDLIRLDRESPGLAEIIGRFPFGNSVFTVSRATGIIAGRERNHLGHLRIFILGNRHTVFSKDYREIIETDIRTRSGFLTDILISVQFHGKSGFKYLPLARVFPAERVFLRAACN